jgi:hypothetical protein
VIRTSLQVIVLGLTVAASANLRAQPAIPNADSAPKLPAASENAASSGLAEGPAGLADLFGTSRTERLMHSVDLEDRLNGLERAAAAHTPEALALLLKFRDEGAGASGDPRTLLAIVHGLADWVERPAARAELLSIARNPAAFLSARVNARSDDPIDDERVRAARTALAQKQAAMALASSRHPEAIKALLEIVRGSEAGREAAASALATYPPEPPAWIPDDMAAATLQIVSTLSDLRSSGAVLRVAHATDAEVRTASMVALAGLGDARAADAARALLRNPEPRIRVAAATALVRVADPGGEDAVQDLISQDETAEDGLRLAQNVQGERVTKAIAARAMASANPALRLAAVAALARQKVNAAVQALSTLAGDPVLAGAAAQGLARSPSESAIAAIEELGTRGASRRLAGRAYFVRRYTRGDRSHRLDAILDELGRSTDGRDRAVALEAKVALGEIPIEAAWLDRDVRVRRAAALGAMGRLDGSVATVLLQRLAIEPDEATRVVLAGVLALGDSPLAPSSSALIRRVDTGQPDAALAAFVLGQRDDRSASEREKLYASRDPVVRANALRGLGASLASDATSRLAWAYRWEANDDVRRAIVEALTARARDRAFGISRRTLDLAARLDPDAGARGAARRALAGSDPARAPVVPEVAWIVLAAAEGGALPADATGMLVESDGLGRPVAFDDDGFALLPGIRSGDAWLRLAARLPPYSPGGP